MRASTRPVNIRRLRWPEERDAWLDFVAACFKSKGTPREYFERHLLYSADANEPLILVATDECSTFCASLRIFRLKQKICGRSYTNVGGIGEVCTHPNYRRRGIGRQLLEEAVKSMKNQEMDYSILHASKHLREFYVRAGWNIALPVRRRLLRVMLCNNASSFSGILCRRGARSDIPSLYAIWKEFSEARIDSGIQLRDLDRFRRWSWVELAVVGTLWVAEHDGDIVGYCSVVETAHSYRCREYGVSSKREDALHALFHTAASEAAPSSATEATIICDDTPFLASMCSSSAVEDDAFMVHALDNNNENITRIMGALGTHWNSDNF